MPHIPERRLRRARTDISRLAEALQRLGVVDNDLVELVDGTASHAESAERLLAASAVRSLLDIARSYRLLRPRTPHLIGAAVTVTTALAAEIAWGGFPLAPGLFALVIVAGSAILELRPRATPIRGPRALQRAVRRAEPWSADEAARARRHAERTAAELRHRHEIGEIGDSTYASLLANLER